MKLDEIAHNEGRSVERGEKAAQDGTLRNFTVSGGRQGSKGDRGKNSQNSGSKTEVFDRI